jgi:transcriptional regulator GlxA family with amidase domain
VFSEHTLRGCCAVVLGVSPLRYIQLLRLNRVRAAILHADAKKARIADLAADGGFTRPGRFAVLYRTAFGEAPSTTLRRAGGDLPIFAPGQKMHSVRSS